MKDDLVTAQRAGIEHTESIGDYESFIDEMMEEYEATIHHITPLFFEKRWVKTKASHSLLLC